jgi:hypothetical protein
MWSSGPETAEHYILYCTKYVTARNKLKNNIELINIPFVLNVLLYDDEGIGFSIRLLLKRSDLKRTTFLA